MTPFRIIVPNSPLRIGARTIEARTTTRRSTGWFPDSRDFIPRVKAHYSCNPIFIRDTAVCRNHGKSLSRRTYRAKRCVYMYAVCVCVCVCSRGNWKSGRTIKLSKNHGWIKSGNKVVPIFVSIANYSFMYVSKWKRRKFGRKYRRSTILSRRENFQ